MEMLGALTGLIGAGLQAKAQNDALMLGYAKFNWEKQRADKSDRFAQASRTDQYGNKTGYDELLNEWNINLTPQQKRLMQGGEKEQLLQLQDAGEARKVKRQIQERAHQAKEPFLKAAAGYQYDQPRSEKAIRSDLTSLMASNDMLKSKADQALIMRQAQRLGRGGDAQSIINATDRKLGDKEAVQNRMLQARNEAVKEYAGRVQLHEGQWGAPMKIWGDLMAQGGDIPNIPARALADSTGAMQQGMASAFANGTRGVGGAFDSLIGAAGKSPDLSSVVTALVAAGKNANKGKSTAKQTTYDDPQYGGVSSISKAHYDDSRDEYGINSGNDYSGF